MDQSDFDKLTPDELRALAAAKEWEARPKPLVPTCDCLEWVKKHSNVLGTTYQERVMVGQATVDDRMHGRVSLVLWADQKFCCQCGAPFKEAAR